MIFKFSPNIESGLGYRGLQPSVHSIVIVVRDI